MGGSKPTVGPPSGAVCVGGGVGPYVWGHGLLPFAGGV